MADAGCSGRRARRHFADVQDHILTGRFGARNSESRPSQAGQEPTVATGSFLASPRAFKTTMPCPRAWSGRVPGGLGPQAPFARLTTRSMSRLQRAAQRLRCREPVASKRPVAPGQSSPKEGSQQRGQAPLSSERWPDPECGANFGDGGRQPSSTRQLAHEPVHELPALVKPAHQDALVAAVRVVVAGVEETRHAVHRYAGGAQEPAVGDAR